jgi:hypothetical protein
LMRSSARTHRSCRTTCGCTVTDAQGMCLLTRQTCTNRCSSDCSHCAPQTTLTAQ